jgi:hypothetical protein
MGSFVEADVKKSESGQDLRGQCLCASSIA